MALQLAELDSLIDRLPEKLDTHINKLGTNLSGGEKQRLSLARLLLKMGQSLNKELLMI